MLLLPPKVAVSGNGDKNIRQLPQSLPPSSCHERWTNKNVTRLRVHVEHFTHLFKLGKIYDPKDPRRQFASVALEDVGKCAADILRKPYTHYNKTYKIVGQTYSMVDMSVSMSKVHGDPNAHTSSFLPLSPYSSSDTNNIGGSSS